MPIPTTPHKLATSIGVWLCLIGVLLLFGPWMLSAAIGVELVGLSFWIWSRTAADAREQVPRWDWLRRPAIAMWMALAIHAANRGPRLFGVAVTLRETPVAWFEAVAIVWAGLELVAALPLARRYSDLPGPHQATRPWIPVVLPCAGFLVLWSQSPHWLTAPGVRAAATFLLVITALLSSLRAFARRGWTASLRWLAVTHTAVALIPLAMKAVDPQAVFLLWMAGYGGPAFVLAGELTGASPRRGRVNARLWRLASWISIALLSWVALVALLRLPAGPLRWLAWIGVAIAVAISTWIMVGRLDVAPERRRIMRPGAGTLMSRLAAIVVLLLGPAGMAFAWWEGFEPHWFASVLAVVPALLGGIAANAPRQTRPIVMGPVVHRISGLLRAVAGMVFPLAVGFERRVLRAMLATGRTLVAPIRDLHTGDAQEYLLFVSGVAVLVLLLPLLR
jgi:hypothetical protein